MSSASEGPSRRAARASVFYVVLGNTNLQETAAGGHTNLFAEPGSVGGFSLEAFEFSMPHLRSWFMPGSIIAVV